MVYTLTQIYVTIALFDKDFKLQDKISNGSEVQQQTLRKKCPWSELSGPYFPEFRQYLSVLSPNTGKYELEKTRYLDTFRAVGLSQKYK